jgi:ketosteroid isomerase-like protein
VNRDEWTRDLFRCVDAKDSDGWLEFLAADARFRFGNAPAVQGKDAIREAVSAFFASISELRHELVEIWNHADAVICRGDVIYTRLDGSTLIAPFANVLKLQDNLIRDYLIYADVSDLYSSPADRRL